MICKFCNKLKENVCECSMNEFKERIQEVLKEYDENEKLSLIFALDKIKEIVDFN